MTFLNTVMMIFIRRQKLFSSSSELLLSHFCLYTLGPFLHLGPPIHFHNPKNLPLFPFRGLLQFFLIDQ
jgi:hypothetical protein